MDHFGTRDCDQVSAISEQYETFFYQAIENAISKDLDVSKEQKVNRSEIAFNLAQNRPRLISLFLFLSALKKSEK